MQDFTDTQPATRPPGVAVCDDGTLIPLTVEQWLDNWFERGTPLKKFMDVVMS